MDSTRRRANLRGITWMIVGVGVLALMDAGLKQLAGHYPPMQVAALRGLVAMPIVAAWALARGGLRPLWRVRWPLHLLRGALAVAMLACFAYGLKTLPLVDAYALFFVAPLVITVLSALVLKERVGLGRWLAIVAGLLGVLIVLRPDGGGWITLAGLSILLAAVGYAVSAVTVNVLARTDSTHAMMFWMTSILALGATALAAPHWVAVRMADAWTLAGVGVTGAVGQFALTEAFRHGEASVVAPFEYSALLWGLGLDFVLWNTLPDATTWLGAGIVVASGVFLLRRERGPANETELHP